MRKVASKSQESIAFEFYEALKYVLRDLELINIAIPRESSRSVLPGYRLNGKRAPEMDIEARAIIEARKNDLLDYVQTICHDHLFWGKQLLAKGWTSKQRDRKAQTVRGKSVTELAGY